MSIDSEAIARRLSAMKELLDHLKSLGVASASDLDDFSIRIQTQYCLAQVVNLASEINAHVSATHGSPPEDYRQGFDKLAKVGFITSDLASALKPSAGLRNVLIHEYTDIDLAKVAAAVPLALRDYGEYIRQVSRKLI